jgi:hypothetical protein
MRNSCQFLKIFLSETALPKGTDIWWEAPMEGSVLNFLKARHIFTISQLYYVTFLGES